MKKSIFTLLFLVIAGVGTLLAQVENPFRLDFRGEEYLYTLAEDNTPHYTQPFGNNWWWNDNTDAAAPYIDGDSLIISIGARATVAKDDLGNEFGSVYGIAITTPQVYINTEDFPLLAVKFTELPDLSEYGYFRYQQIVRGESNADGANHDWFFRVDPDASADVYYCTHLEDEDGGVILVFDLSKSARVHRWTLKNEANAQADPAAYYKTLYAADADGAIGDASSIIPVGKSIRSDITFVWEGVLDANQKAKMSWMKGFATIDDVYAYAWPENTNNDFSLDFRTGDYLYTLAADNAGHNTQPFGNNWWWNDNTEATPPYAEAGMLNISIGARATAGKDDLGNLYASVYGITITTPQVYLNTEEFPLLAAKFKTVPAMAEGYTKFAYQQIVRGESNADGANHDWFFRVDPNASADVSYCTQIEDEDGGMIYIFDLSQSAKVHRWTLKNEANAQADPAAYYKTEFAAAEDGAIGDASSIIPVGKAIRSDVTFSWEGVLDDTQVAELSWLKSFASLDDVYGFAWTAIDEVKLEALDAFGSQNLITVRGLDKGSNVQVFNLAGQMIDTRIVGQSTYNLNTKNGIYIVRVLDKGQIRTAKVLVY
ncbi:T9SS type A sorting domain-containing protein [Saccharicrinis sp. FJH62]|uniref:T9SS type A sorting domain-containing protein n=1 Tax=Saccharicrinis sp. FJH62 TaxID=3344657 RepID=UPI0035D44817